MLKNKIELTFYQSNIEGEIIKKLKSRNVQDGLIINAGGYTRTSVAIHDALKILNTNYRIAYKHVYNEKFRHKSLISKVAKGVICGFGANGYIMSLQGLIILEK